MTLITTINNSLNNKSDKSNSYTRAEIIGFIESYYTFNGSFLKITDPETGKFRISLNPLVSSTNSIFSSSIDVQAPSQNGGGIRIIPAQDIGNSSIGYYNYMDKRSSAAGDVWISGIYCDNEQGYSIRTPVLNTCFNIQNHGNINIPYGLSTNGAAINVIIANTSSEITFGRNVLITGNLNITGNVIASNLNPFDIGGKVSGGGAIISNKGRITFTVVRTSTGVFVITPTIGFGNTNYLINISCQYGGGTGCYSVFTNSLTATGFTVIIMNNATYYDCIFHFTVIN